MSEPIGALRAEMSAGYASFISDMQKAKQGVQVNAAGMAGAMAKVKNSFDSTVKSLLGVRGAIVAAAGATALGAVIKRSIDAAEEMNKMSQQTGVATEKLSALSYAAEISEVPLETLSKGLVKLAKSTEEAVSGSGKAKDSFKALGIDIQNNNGSVKTSDELLLELADKFKGLSDGTEKTALAMKFFGKSGADMIPLLNQGSAGIKEATDQAKRLGLVLSTEAGIAADEFNDQLTEFRRVGTGFARTLMVDMLPGLNEFLKVVKNAYEESGLLTAAWVALGGVGDAIFNKNLNQQIRDAQKELADLEAKKKERMSAWSAPWVDKSERGSTYDKQISDARAALKLLTDEQDRNKASAAEAARIKAEAEEKEAALKEKNTLALRKQLTAEAERETAEKKAITDAENRKKRGEEMITSMERELTATHDLTREEKARWELSEGKDKDLLPAQKQKIIALAQELDVLDAVIKAEEERKANRDAIDDEISALQLQADSFNLTATAAKLYEMSLKGATDEQLESAKVLMDDLEIKKQVAQVMEDIKTPLDDYAEKMRILNDLLAVGEINQGQYAEATERARKTLEDATKDENKMMEDLKQSIEGWGRDASNALVDFAIDGKGSFSDFADSVIKDMMRMIVYQNMLKPLMDTASNGSFWSSAAGAIGSFFGSGTNQAALESSGFQGSHFMMEAHGDAFSKGRVTPLASDGIVNRPTIFPMASGMGLMGEDGPEAVMPLTRTAGGNLGVEASGGGNHVNINIINKNGSSVTAEQKETSQGMQIDVMIDQAVAKKLGQSGTASNRAMKNTFGAKESLVTR